MSVEVNTVFDVSRVEAHERDLAAAMAKAYRWLAYEGDNTDRKKSGSGYGWQVVLESDARSYSEWRHSLPAPYALSEVGSVALIGARALRQNSAGRAMGHTSMRNLLAGEAYKLGDELVQALGSAGIQVPELEPNGLYPQENGMNAEIAAKKGEE